MVFDKVGFCPHTYVSTVYGFLSERNVFVITFNVMYGQDNTHKLIHTRTTFIINIHCTIKEKVNQYLRELQTCMEWNTFPAYLKHEAG